MEFIPQVVVVGAIVYPPDLAQSGRVEPDRLDAVWKGLREEGLKYGSFQLTPDENGAVITGSRPGDMVNISPPLVQVQVPLDDGSSVEVAARRARTVVDIAARAFRVPQILNLGVRATYRVPLHTNDARELLLNRILSHGGEKVDELRLDQEIWGGTKFVVPHASGQYTIQIEPLVADQMKSLFLDVDGQYPGPADPSSVETRAADLERYVHDHIDAYLGKIANTGGTT